MSITEYTNKAIILDAKKHNHVDQWLDTENGIELYIEACKRQILEQCFHLTKRGVCEKHLLTLASRYNTRAELRDALQHIYFRISRKRLSPIAFKHMTPKKPVRDLIILDAEIIENAKNFKTIKEWRKSYPSQYNIARQRKILQACTAHMNRLISTPIPNAEIIANAIKFETIKGWRENYRSQYSIAGQRNILPQCSAHMKRSNEAYWTKDVVFDSAKDFDHPVDWKNHFPTAYQTAANNKWIKEIKAEMKQRRDQNWNLASVAAIALQYTALKPWTDNHPASITYAKEHGIMHLCVGHMCRTTRKKYDPDTLNDRPILTPAQLNILLATTEGYDSYVDWRTSHESKSSEAYRYGVNDIVRKAIRDQRDKIWTYQKVMLDAIQYNTIPAWRESSKGAYEFAKDHGIYAIATKHMVPAKRLDK